MFFSECVFKARLFAAHVGTSFLPLADGLLSRGHPVNVVIPGDSWVVSTLGSWTRVTMHECVLLFVSV